MGEHTNAVREAWPALVKSSGKLVLRVIFVPFLQVFGNAAEEEKTAGSMAHGSCCVCRLCLSSHYFKSTVEINNNRMSDVILWRLCIANNDNYISQHSYFCWRVIW